MRKAVLCDSLTLAANPLFSPVGVTIEVMDLEEPKTKPLGPICFPSLQSSAKAAACVSPGRAAPEGHLPAGTSQPEGLAGSAGKSLSELEGKDEGLWGLLHSPSQSKGLHWLFSCHHPLTSFVQDSWNRE